MEERCRDIERSIIKTYRKSIWRKFVKGIQEYDLLQEHDKVAVCISGGKDSMLMAKLFQELQRHGKFDFELVFLVMDPGYNLENRKRIEENASLLNVPIHIFETTIFNSVVNAVTFDDFTTSIPEYVAIDASINNIITVITSDINVIPDVFLFFILYLPFISFVLCWILF